MKQDVSINQTSVQIGSLSLISIYLFTTFMTISYDYDIKLFKVVSATFLLVCFLSLNESTCQTKKNTFYFTSKALFVLKKIKF